MSVLPDFDLMWDYSDPDGTESKFRDILSKEDIIPNSSYHLQLLTQLGRTYSLRKQFDAAHKRLDEVKAKLTKSTELAHVRYHLERGRTFNSSSKKKDARKEFEKALADGLTVGEDFHTIDAMHMIAIVGSPAESIEWNEKAIEKAMSSENERARNWLGSLYNNLGWSFFGIKDFDRAMEIFQKGYDWQLSNQRIPQLMIAKWSIGRTLRAQSKMEEALKIQTELLSENPRPDIYNYDEMMECLKALGRKEEAKKYEDQAKVLFKN